VKFRIQTECTIVARLIRRVFPKQRIEIHVTQSSDDRVRNTDMTGFHGVEELSNLTANAFFFATDTGDREKTLSFRIVRGKTLGNVHNWSYPPQGSFLGLGDGWERRDPAVK